MELFLLRALAGPIAVFSSIVLALLLVAPGLLYVLARWRAHREPVPDPQLGLKFLLHFFSSFALQVALAGGALLLYTVMSPGPSDVKSPAYRMALGLLIPGVAIAWLPLSLLRRTNDLELPGVRRMFSGYNLLVIGLFAFLGLVLGFQALFARGSSDGLGHAGGSMILVYGGACAVIGSRFVRLVLGGGGGSAIGGPPVYVAPPVAPVPPPPAAGLPRLGGGGYPPIGP
ncbi:MAG: hypothetical protein ACTHU0_04150 [Kofleriaceae bacterium]